MVEHGFASNFESQQKISTRKLMRMITTFTRGGEYPLCTAMIVRQPKLQRHGSSRPTVGDSRPRYTSRGKS
jgi:hypothetical protein